MASATAPSSAPPVKRILYKEISNGDLRKLRAESNDSDSGGGARDLRLPEGEFRDVIRRLLPQEIKRQRKVDGHQTEITILTGPVIHPVSKDGETKELKIPLEWWPPTTARPAEGRIARVHEALPMPKEGLGRVFFLLIQDTAGAVYSHYAYEDHLRAGLWRTEVSQPLLRCCDALDRKKPTVQGYIDYTTNVQFCHGL